ncbi:MAG: DUF4421 domain-containing protein [Muribaculaceae bacterium]|nr:DUF4421 domain-containing protein [Muribaculaceae bacterium]
MTILIFTALGLQISAQGPRVCTTITPYNIDNEAPQTPESEEIDEVSMPRISPQDSYLNPVRIPQDTLDVVSLPDSTAYLREYVNRKESPNWWTNRIRSHTFNIGDSTVIYPKFLQFCVNVYNWGDHFFNTYDPEYVVGTGKKWKAMVKLSNWTDSYAMTLHKTHIRMLSNVYSNVGPYISFMAVSVGYEANLNRLISHIPARQKRWEFNFSTSLFWVNAYYTSNRDGTIIRNFGSYRDAKGHSWIHQKFPDLQLRNYGVDLYYFFNHKRYSQGAAYSFSKYQLKSQGSLLLGFSFSHQYIDMDFAGLPGAMLTTLPEGSLMHYTFSYNDYCLMLGYGYNIVPGKHWLLNITALPNVGVKHCMPETTGGRREMFSLNMRGDMSAVYNLDSFFLGIFGHVDLHWFNTSRLSFINAVVSFGAQAGFRF